MTAPAAQFGAGNVTSASVSSGTTFTANKPANVADGDLLCAVVLTHRAAATWSTVPSGWTSVGPSQNTVGTLGVWTKPIPSAAAESATSYSWVASNTDRGGIIIFRVTGGNAIRPGDASSGFVTTGTNSIVAPATVAIDATALLIAVYITNNSTTTPSAVTPPGTMTEIAQVSAAPASSTVLEVAAQQLGAAGSTGTRTATVSPSATSAAGATFTLGPPVTGSAALAGVGTLTAAGIAGAFGSAALTAAGTLTAAGGKVGALGSVALTGVGTLTVNNTPPFNVLLSDGTWAPVTRKVLIAGTWVP